MKLSEDGFGLLPITESNLSLLATFNSSNQFLNEFLLNDALPLSQSHVGKTTCVFHADIPDQLIAYFTVSNSSIQLNSSEIFELGINSLFTIPYIPAALIGKFAVHSDFARCGNGKVILNLAISAIIAESVVSACRLIVVDSKIDAKEFYSSCGFINCLNSERRGRNSNSKTIKMYLDILNIGQS